jgi:type II secretory pathway pseudopilin PulG
MVGSVLQSKSEAGFVLLEALVAAALVAMAGTIILMTGQNSLRAQDSALDRSAALVTMETFSRVFQVLGAEAAATVLPADDETFRYALAPTGDAGDVGAVLRYLKLEAHFKTSPTLPPLTLEFLAPLKSAATAGPP